MKKIIEIMENMDRTRKIMILVVLIVMLSLEILIFYPTAYTGFGIYSPHGGVHDIINIGKYYTDSSAQELNISKDIFSMQMTGYIEGNGTVAIYLEGIGSDGNNVSLMILNSSEIIENITAIDENLTNTTQEGNDTDINISMNETRKTLFTDYCRDTCLIDGLSGPYTLIIGLDTGSSVYIDSIGYDYAKEILQSQNIPDISYTENYTINLSGYFNSEGLLYDISSLNNSAAEIIGDTLVLTARTSGIEEAYIYATDGKSLIMSNKFNLTTSIAASTTTSTPEPAVPQSTISESNIKIDPEVMTELDRGETRVIIRFKANAQGNDSRVNYVKKNIVSPEAENKIRNNNLAIQTDTNQSTIITEQDLGDVKSATVTAADLESLKQDDSISEIILDKKVEALVYDSINITRINDVQKLNYTGRGVNVCILDTGINYILFNMTLNDSVFGYDFISSDPDPMDDNGHGTEVAYALLKSSPDIRLYVAKVLDSSGTGYYSDILAGLDYCQDNNASIISMSIGSGGSDRYCDDIVAQKVDDLFSLGILTIASSGNDGSHLVKSPACAQDALPVAASTKQGTIAAFSNYNNATLLVAPGQDISTISNYGDPISVSGTSMSVPFVTGAAALLLQDENIGPADIKNLLVHTGDVINYDGRQFAQLNALNALYRNYTNNLTENYLNSSNSSQIQNITEIFTTLTTAVSRDGGTFASVDTPNGPSEAVWNKPDNALRKDTIYANVTIDPKKSPNTSQYLKVTNFGFSIPSDATINGINVTVTRKATTKFWGKDYSVVLFDENGAVMHDNKADYVTQYPTSDTDKSYGNATDTWGSSPTPTTINSINFGVGFSSQGIDLTTANVSVDYIRITVYYTPAPVVTPNYTYFNGTTTNFSNYTTAQLGNLSNVTLEVAGKGKIVWNAPVNVSSANFDNNVMITDNSIFVNSSGLPSSLNSSANLTIYALPFRNPYILRDGQPCSTCNVISYIGGNLTFSAVGFSNYTTGESIFLNYSDPTPANNYATTNNYATINISIINSTNMSTFIWNWNGTNYTMYNDSLVLMLNFDNVSALGENGTRIVDASKYSNNGTCSGTGCPTFNATGKYGADYQYDGITNYWNISDSSSLDMTYAITMSLWYKSLTFTDWAAAIDKLDNAASYTSGYAVRFATLNRTICTLQTATGNKDLLTTVANATDGNWHHLACVYDPSAGQIYMYFDGKNISNLSATGAIVPGSNKLNIGRGSRTGFGREFNGSLDEIRIWSRSLSAAEISQLYKSNLNKYATDKWQFISNQTNLSVGTYTYYAWANNTLSTNQTDVRTLNITSLVACSNLTSPNTVWTLTSNLAINGLTCFNVSAQNVTINCNGYKINGTNTTDTYGIYTNMFNTTIKNCNITNFYTGIGFDSANNGLITNVVTSSNANVGVYLIGSYNVLTNITALSNPGQGVYVINGGNNNLTNANISSGGNGLTVQTTSGNIFSNITSEDNTNQWAYYITSSGNRYNNIRLSRGVYGLVVLPGYSGVVIENITIDNVPTYGIYPNSATYNNFTNIIAKGGNIYDAGSNNRYVNCVMGKDDTYPIRLIGASNETYINCTGNTSGTYEGIYLSGSSNGNSFIGSKGISTQKSSIYITGGQNILIDCNGTSIIGYNVTGAYGVFSNQQNTTVQNCVIQNFSTGILYNGSTNGLIQNNNITITYNGGNAIRITNNAHRNTINNNKISTTSASGIYVDGGQNISIDCLGTSMTGANYTDTYGVYSSMFNTTVKNCIINWFGSGIVFSGMTNGTIGNVTIQTAGSSGFGILLNMVNYSTIANATATATWGTGTNPSAIYLNSSSFNSISKTTGISNDAVYCAYFGSSNNNTISNFNCTTFVDGTTFVLSGSSGNVISNLTTKINNDAGMLLTSGSNSNTIANSTLDASAAVWYALQIDSSSNNSVYNNTFISPSYTLLSIISTSSKNTFYWNNFTATTGAYVNDAVGSNFYNTTISGHGEGNIWANVLSNNVNVTGSIPSLFGAGLFLGTSGSGYPYNSSTSQGKFVCGYSGCGDYAPLTPPLQCGVLSSAGTTYVLASNISINSASCFNVTAQNITLNCNGYKITGSNAAGSFGLYSNQQNTTIKNCIFSSWSTAINLDAGSNRSTLNNDIIRNAKGADASALSVVGITILSNLNILTNVSISNLTGGSGWPDTGDGASGGGVVQGIILSSASYNNITNLTISNNSGGIGGDGSVDYCNGGGAGGAVYPIYVYGGANDNFLSDINITGNNGGVGGADDNCGNNGGAGGGVLAIYLYNSFRDIISSINVFSNKGGMGGADMGTGAGTGGSVTGVQLYLGYDNSINTLTATNNVGGTGGSDSIGCNIGGGGGSVYGLIMTYSSRNNFTGLNITGNNGGAPDPGNCNGNPGYGGGVMGSSLSYSDNNTFSGATIANTPGIDYGAGTSGSIGLIGSYSNNDIFRNISITSNTGYGLEFLYSSNDLYSNMMINGSDIGIYLLSCTNNSIQNSTAISASTSGIYLQSTSYSTIVNSSGASSAEGIYFYASSYNNITNTVGSSSAGSFGISLLSSSNYNRLTNCTGSSLYGKGFYIGSNYSTISNSLAISNSSNALYISSGSNNILFNNTFRSSGGASTLALLMGSSSNNSFYWNNFSATTGKYVNDTNGSNYYNTSIAGQAAGNIWANVINKSVNISGNISSPFANLYYGSFGSNYPYNSTNSLGKVFGNVIDYGPLVTDTLPPSTTVSAVDNKSATYTFNYPISSSYINVTLSCSALGGDPCDKTQYCKDTSNSCTPNIDYAIPVQVTTEGTSYIRYRSNDTSGNLESTNSNTIIIDTIIPAISYQGQTDANNSFVNRAWSFVNVSISEAASSCSLNWSGTVSSMINSSSTSWYLNKTGLGDGSYTYYVRCNDTANNYNSTDNMVLKVDTTIPNIFFQGQTDANNSFVNRAWSFVNVSQNDLDNGTYFIDWNRSLIGWWRFNNEAGENSTFFKDWSAYGNNATCSGTGCPTFNQSGRFGGDLDYGGAQSIITRNQTMNMLNPAFTLTAWVKDSSGGLILRRQTSSTMLSLSLDSDDNFVSCGFSNATVTNNVFTPSLSYNTWYFIACTFNGTYSMIYVDGVMEASSAATSISFNDSASIYIGNGESAGPGMTGSIDDVKLFSRALSAQEINASYNASIPLYNNFTDLGQSTYTYAAYSQDLAGNVNHTEQRILTVDTIPPVINFIAPTDVNGANITQNWSFVNVSISEAASSCSLNWSDTISPMINSSSTSWYLNKTDLGGGSYTYYVICNDTANNIGTSEVRTLNYSNPSVCANLNTSNVLTTLKNNVSINGATCFNVTAQNVTLNCSGYSITGNNTLNTYGVYSDQFNTTIDNCRVSNFSTGIYFVSATNGLINNSQIASFSGIIFISSSKNKIDLSRINATKAGSNYALQLSGGSGNLISNTNTSSVDNTVDMVSSASYNNFTNVNFLSDGSGAVVSVGDNCANNKFNIFNITAGDQNVGGPALVFSNGASTNVISNGTINSLVITGAGTSAVQIASDSQNVQFSNVNISAVGKMALLVSATGNANIFTNTFMKSQQSIACSIIGSRNKFYNVNCTSQNSSSGMYLQYANNTLLNNSIIYANTSASLYIEASNNSVIVNNTIFSGNGTGNLVFVAANSSNNRFYWNNFTATTGLYVNDSNGTNFYNTTMSGHGEGNIYYNVLNGSVVITGSTPSLYGASLFVGTSGLGYPYNSSNSLDKFACSFSGCGDYAPLTPPLQCGVLFSASAIYILAVNLSVNSSTCLNVTTQNVTLDCAGLSITGNNTPNTYGFYSNQLNTTVKNCVIQNFSEAIRYFGATDGLIFNNTLNTTFNGGNAIRITSGAHRNSITQNTINNGNASGVYIDGGENVTVDCGDTLMNGSNYNNAIGIYSAQYGTLIKNCVINHFIYGIYLAPTSNNSLIKNNTVSNARPYTCFGVGCTGYDAYGIFVSSSNVNITLNNITNISGGDAGNGSSTVAGGVGGYPYGIYLSSSQNTTLDTNFISDLLGGAGGVGTFTKSSGTGGSSLAIYILSSNNNNNNVVSSDIRNIAGHDGPSVSQVGGGDAGNGTGIYIYSSSNNNISQNIINNITGGIGGISLGNPSAKGGAATALLLISSPNNALFSNNASNIGGGIGGSSGHIGGAGGDSIGIFIISSSNAIIYSNNINSLVSSAQSTGPDANGKPGHSYGISIASGNNSLISNNSVSVNNISGYAIIINNSNSNIFINTTLMNPPGNLTLLTSDSSNNTFYWNNFTATSGVYVNDMNGSNYYNTSISSTAAGNMWANVLNGSVKVAGSVMSPFSGLYYGSKGSGFPYNNVNSQGKLSGNVIDYGPLTYNYTIITVHLVSPANNTNITDSNVTLTCNISSSVNTTSLTVYVWNSTGSLISVNTTSIWGMYNSTSMYVTLPYADVYRWNCLGNDSGEVSSWSDEGNYTLRTPAPDNVTLKSPTNGNTTIHARTPLFEWYAANNAISYEINITSNYCPDIFANTTNTSYTPSQDLCVKSDGAGDTYYNWSVRACNSYFCGNWSLQWNFTIEPWVVISLVNDSVDFGNVVLRQVVDTESGSPGPLLIQNDGNVAADLINITADRSLWASAGAGLETRFFQMKVRNTSEQNSFNISASITDWINVSYSNVTMLTNLNYNDPNDSAYIDVKIEVPSDEPPGAKNANLMLYWRQQP